jgi:hypothetical protein
MDLTSIFAHVLKHDKTSCSKVKGCTTIETDSCKHPIPTTLHITSHPLHQTHPTDFSATAVPRFTSKTETANLLTGGKY